MFELGYENLGFINLALIYFMFCTTALLATPINRKLGHKWTLILAAATYAIWEASFIMVAYKFENYKKDDEVPAILSNGSIIFFNFFSGFLLGTVAGPFWVTQSAYLS